jgi:outer membrane receptor protein involved in Fe transport
MDKQVRSLSPVMGPVRKTAPFDHSWGATYGDRLQLAQDLSIGWLAAYTYTSKYEYYDNGVSRTMVGNQNPDGDLIFGPYKSSSEDPDDLGPDQYVAEEGKHTVGWGLGGVIGLEYKDYKLKLNYLRTQQTEERAQLLTDTKTNLQHKYGRNESLVYTSRSMESLQLEATLPLEFLDIPELMLGFDPGIPVVEWAGAQSQAVQDQPDRRFFFGIYQSERGYWEKPHLENIFAERSWRTITEDTDFQRIDLTWPFEIGDDREGKLKLGYSDEDTHREYTQDTVYYLDGDGYYRYYSTFDEPWSQVFLEPERLGYPIFGLGAEYDPAHPGRGYWIIEDFERDINYTGELLVNAMYGMGELPLFPWLKLIAGMRIEDTSMSTEVHAASGDDDNVEILDVRGFLDDVAAGEEDLTLTLQSPASYNPAKTLSEVADANIKQVDRLPSVGVALNVVGHWTLRGTWSRTIGRPTFKELTPVAQQDHLGGQAFAGNPALTISELTNYDLRLEWNPGDGRLFSISGFTKEIDAPIDYSLRPTKQNQLYILPFNYPEGQVTGFEVEARFPLGGLHRVFKGVSVGANFTLLDATVKLLDYEADELKENLANLDKDTSDIGERRMKDQPEYIANFYVLYDLERTGTSIGVFLNHTGETLVAGESYPTAARYVPNLVKKPVTSLDVNISQKLWEHFKLSISLGNLLNPEIEEVWQSDYVEQGEATASSYRKGISVSVSLSGSW